MVASGVSVVIDMALLPLFWIVGVATWEMANSATSELGKSVRMAKAFTVVGVVTEKGALYTELEAVGMLPSVV